MGYKKEVQLKLNEGKEKYKYVGELMFNTKGIYIVEFKMFERNNLIIV